MYKQAGIRWTHPPFTLISYLPMALTRIRWWNTYAKLVNKISIGSHHHFIVYKYGGGCFDQSQDNEKCYMCRSESKRANQIRWYKNRSGESNLIEITCRQEGKNNKILFVMRDCCHNVWPFICAPCVHTPYSFISLIFIWTAKSSTAKYNKRTRIILIFSSYYLDVLMKADDSINDSSVTDICVCVRWRISEANANKNCFIKIRRSRTC